MTTHRDDTPTAAVDDNASLAPSKSQRKRDAQALTRLGEQLLALPQPQLDAIELPADLAEALREARAIKAYGGRKRQLKFIGKLLRQVDTDALAINIGLQLATAGSRAATARQHQLERWVTALLGDKAESASTLTDLLNRYPDADRQRLRQLIRSATREHQRELPSRSRRQLFRALRELLARHDSNTADDNDDIDPNTTDQAG